MFLLGFPHRGGGLEPTVHGVVRTVVGIAGAALITTSLAWYVRRGLGRRPKRRWPGWTPPR